MKKMKNRKGFTLVELIVVIAILAILAAVAIPVYSNYIKKANEAADLSGLDAIKTAAVFGYTEAKVAADPAADTTVYSISYADNATTATVKSSASDTGTSVTITDYTSQVDFKSAAYDGKTATWTAAGGWTAG